MFHVNLSILKGKLHSTFKFSKLQKLQQWHGSNTTPKPSTSINQSAQTGRSIKHHKIEYKHSLRITLDHSAWDSAQKQLEKLLLNVIIQVCMYMRMGGAVKRWRPYFYIYVVNVRFYEHLCVATASEAAIGTGEAIYNL